MIYQKYRRICGVGIVSMDTDDYYSCKECPNCKIQPIHIMRTSSFGFVYSHISKHPELYDMSVKRDKNIDEIIKD